MEFVPVHLVDKKIAAKLEVKSLDIPQLANIGQYLTFKVSVYAKLNSLKQEKRLFGSDYKSWSHTFATVNHFLSLLSHDDKCEILYALALMHQDIVEFFVKEETDDLTKLTDKLSDYCNDLDLAINLCDKLRQYAIDHVPIGLMPNAGNRPQDSAKLTFYPEEVKTLMSIVILCKLLTPIFGVLMENLLDKVDIRSKEGCCATILTKLFDRKYHVLIDKLKHYIGHIVRLQCKDDTTSALMHGCDSYSLSHSMYSQLLIRQFVNVPLLRDNGNLITYISVSVKKAIATVRSTILKKPTYTRHLYASNVDDDGNISRLETDSIASRKTCDVPILVKCAVPYAIRKYSDFYSIDLDEYEASLKFYNRNPMVPTIINKDLNATFYSRDFGGGKGILMLKSDDYIKITAMLQLILLTLGGDDDDGYEDLAHVLTVLPSMDTQLGYSFEDNQFQLNVGFSQAYNNCRMRFEHSPFGAKGREWVDHIKNITDDLIMSKYRYNTANWIWEWLGTENLNGRLIEPNDKIIGALCDFYDWLHGTMSI